MTNQGSAYLALLSHVSTAGLSDDVTAGKMMKLVSAGRDAQVNWGEWVATLPYALGDVVYVMIDPTNPSVFDAYQAFFDAAPGMDPTMGFPWGRINARPARGIEREIVGKPSSGQVLRYLFNGALASTVLPKNGIQSNAAFLVSPAAALTVTINRRSGGPGGATNAVGTITWAAGASKGTVAVPLAVTFAPGDVLELVLPATVDANASGLLVNLMVY